MKQKRIGMTKRASGRRLKRILLSSAITLAVLALPLLSNAEELQPKESGVRQELNLSLFTQKGYQKTWEAGLGLDAKLKIDPIAINLGVSVSGELLTGTVNLEGASLGLNFPIAPDIVDGMVYAQMSRFLGDQKVVGLSLGGEINSIYLFAGTEYDKIGLIPIYMGVEAPIGPITITTIPLGFIDSKCGQHLIGGEFKITYGTEMFKVFARTFGILDPKTGDPIVGDIRSGAEFPF
ncbi:MAG: hypothetical protein WC501_00865 [Candidatus Micrarchaeia archaeon]